MNKQIEALKIAKQTLSKWGTANDELACEFVQAVRMIDKALEEAEKQEPVAIVMEDSYGYGASLYKRLPLGTKLYTHPATWQSLSDDEIDDMILNNGHLDCVLDFAPSIDNMSVLQYELRRIARAIEQALKEKNHGKSDKSV